MSRSIRRVTTFHHHYDREIKAFVFDPKGFLPVKLLMEHRPEFSGWCKRCWEGDACEHWNLEALEGEGYGPAESARVREAATRLGLRWPWTPDQVIRVFRAQALRAHPDHGGTDGAMCRLLEDRDRLLERCAAADGHSVVA